MASPRELVSFYLEERLYGLDIRYVKEIHPNVRIVSVPKAPSHVRGLVNIRGQVVLVFDVALLFGRPPRPVTDESQIVILKTAPELRSVRGLPEDLDTTPFGDKAVGFIVDRIGDVVQVAPEHTRPTPPHLPARKARFVAGVANPVDDMQIILDARELVLGETSRGNS